MKKLLASFVMLAVLGLCMPSFGYVLIYKLQAYGKAVDMTDANTSSVEYGKVKAYMVLDIEPTQDEETPKQLTDGQSADINESQLIIYDRYQGKNSIKFYETVSLSSIDLILTPQPVEKLAVITIDESGYQVNLVGKLKMTDVGLAKKVNVPQSLAGSMLMDGSFFDESEIIGAATVTGTLEKSLTKAANKDETDVESTSDEIIAGLEKKGFEGL